MIPRLALPGIVLAAFLLLPFLNRPFTIDDPLFIREAEHALADPLHPADFEQVWNAGDRQKLSQYLLGGTLPAYVLAPVAALGSREWVAHLYQFLFLCAFVMASVSVSRRMGCDRMQANNVGLLVALNPVTLAMAATCMPDLMAAAFATIGMDRVLLFREAPRPVTGAAAGAFLAAAVLCRFTTAPLILVAALLLMPTTWRRSLASLWPVGLALILAVGVVLLTRGAASDGGMGAAFASLTSTRNVPRNAISFLAFQALTGPVLLYWTLIRGRWFVLFVACMCAAGFALSRLANPNLHQYAMPAALGLCFLAACVDLVRGLRHVSALAVWFFAGLMALPYVYMSAKYLLPGVPAAALLIVLHAARVRHPRQPLTIAMLLAAGWVLGGAIIVGDTMLAGSQRDAAADHVGRFQRRGHTVWAAGQWAFLHYAQRAGARALGNTPPLPQTGDIIVVSRLDYYGRLHEMPFRRELIYTDVDRRCGFFVLNRELSAGFYSNRFGYLPVAAGCTDLNRYDVYQVQ